MYDSFLASILWYASWPVLVFIIYQLIRFAVKKYEKKFPEESTE